MESILLPTESDHVHDHGEEDVEFSYDVKPLSCQRLMDSDHQIRYSFVKVRIRFCYHQFHHRITSGHQEHIRVGCRDTTCDSYLTMLKLFNLSFPLLSAELSKLGVEQERHYPIAKGIVRWAQTALSGRDPHEVELLTVQVNLVKHVNVQEYYCLECRRVRERNLKREKLKMNLVYTADDAEARAPIDDASSRTAAGKGDESTTSTTCPVCFVEFGAAGTCAVLTPCSHKFHEKCILTWMLKSPSCPLCRFQMPIV
ncbi:43kDa postsynaptic protein [Trema orientale]|uniref:RING-type E3 ubiquitin transferase n=1 Tax=Trema orientale TaxID=63057 RepID=A0A2P5FQB6_TREOI|nr:43kDa postsynaptic protein [Trema orientale]